LSVRFENQQITAAMSLPFWILYLLMEIGFILTVFRSIQAAIKEILNISDEQPAEGTDCIEQTVKQVSAGGEVAGDGKGGA
jgi:TRAP-type C4-dicarboxylate transport system permease small subunit